MNINLAWDAPVPAPDCGYKVSYRRKADPTYSTYDVTGTTSVVGITAPACYEGIINADCCSSTSDGIAFGLNAYVALHLAVNVSGNTATIVMTSPYASPYDILVTAQVNYHVGSSYSVFSGTVTYDAGSTSKTLSPLVVPGIVVDSYMITNMAPIFNNGGQLQQLDPINTPEYFQMYWDGNISGSTWNGSPASLPSFTIDSFTETEVAVDGVTVLAGNLDVSYILSEPSGNTSVVIDVYDGATLIGTSIVADNPLGARYVTIALVKGSSPLANTTQFTMQVSRLNTMLIDSHVFYFP